MILGRCKEGGMGLEDSAGQKEGLVLFAGQRLLGIAHRFEIDRIGLLFILRPTPPIGVSRTIPLGPVQLGSRHKLSIHLAELVPSLRVIERTVPMMVVYLAVTLGLVAVLAEILGQGSNFPAGLSPVRLVTIYSA